MREEKYLSPTPSVTRHGRPNICTHTRGPNRHWWRSTDQRVCSVQVSHIPHKDIPWRKSRRLHCIMPLDELQINWRSGSSFSLTAPGMWQCSPSTLIGTGTARSLSDWCTGQSFAAETGMLNDKRKDWHIHQYMHIGNAFGDPFGLRKTRDAVR